MDTCECGSPRKTSAVGESCTSKSTSQYEITTSCLLSLSEASLQSDWVITELRKTFKAEKQSGRRKLFPVRLLSFATLREWQCFDSDTGKDLAVELRQYFIPDFSQWNEPDKFEAAFSSLLKDLRTEQPAPGNV